MASSSHNYFSKARVETFSDGIFAIVATLLVLEIGVPQIAHHHSVKELLQALWGLLPKVLSWMLSFLMVCVIWVNHHRIFMQLKVITHGLFWLNANLLLWCAFIPFPTALMGDYINNPLPLIFFGVILSLMAFAFYLIRLHILRHPFVLNDDTDLRHHRKAAMRSLLFGPALYLAGAALSLIHPYLGFGVYFFIPLYFIFYNGAKTGAAGAA